MLVGCIDHFAWNKYTLEGTTHFPFSDTWFSSRGFQTFNRDPTSVFVSSSDTLSADTPCSYTAYQASSTTSLSGHSTTAFYSARTTTLSSIVGPAHNPNFSDHTPIRPTTSGDAPDSSRGCFQFRQCGYL